MAKSPKTPIAQLVSDLGGPEAVAAAINRKPGAVRMWMHRRAIPRPAWPDLIEKYPTVTLDQLREMEGRAA